MLSVNLPILKGSSVVSLTTGVLSIEGYSYVVKVV